MTDPAGVTAVTIVKTFPDGAPVFLQDGNRADGYTFVDNRYTVFVPDFITYINQIAGQAGYFRIDFVGQFIQVAAGTVEQADAQGYRADVKVFVLYHFQRRYDFSDG